MKRFLIAGGAAVALAVPTLASAQDYTIPNPTQAASAACKLELKKLGKATFRLTYGTNKNRANAFGKCVSKRDNAEAANASKAKSTCKTQRDDPNWRSSDGQTFADEYGTNKNKSNAYGKCVSSTAKTLSKEQTTDRVNAAKECKAERKADAGAFAGLWGSKRNAFGKCVSATAKENAAERKAAQS
jgi:hypothetical protein